MDGADEVTLATLAMQRVLCTYLLKHHTTPAPDLRGILKDMSVLVKRLVPWEARARCSPNTCWHPPPSHFLPPTPSYPGSAYTDWFLRFYHAGARSKVHYQVLFASKL